MFTLKNVSGQTIEVRHLGKWVSPDETVDVDEKLSNEIEDAYISVRTAKNIVGKDQNGANLYEDEEVFRAWPKAHWEKVSKVKDAKPKAEGE